MHLTLGLAAVAACWQFQTAIVRFIPNAGTFAVRLERTPEMLADPGYALRAVDTNLAGRAAATARPAGNSTAGQILPGSATGRSSS